MKYIKVSKKRWLAVMAAVGEWARALAGDTNDLVHTQVRSSRSRLTFFFKKATAS